MPNMAEMFPDGSTVSFVDEAREFSRLHGDDIRKWWRYAPQGDWMLWVAGQLDVDLKLRVTAACACARTALRFLPEGEQRPSKAIDLAEKWTRGEVESRICAMETDRLYNECNPSESMGGGHAAAAAMTAVAAAETALNTAGKSHERSKNISLAAIAARHAAAAPGYADGIPAMRETHK